MTAYYIRVTVGQRVLRTQEIVRDTIDEAQTFATQGFLANLRMEGISFAQLKLDILHKVAIIDTQWYPSCRGRWASPLMGWVWSYAPGNDD